jgi:hypothetical protein
VCHTEQVLTKWKHIKQFRYLIFLQFVWKDNKHLLLFAWHNYKETIYIYEFESWSGKVHSMQHHVIKFNKIVRFMTPITGTIFQFMTLFTDKRYSLMTFNT